MTFVRCLSVYFNPDIVTVIKDYEMDRACSMHGEGVLGRPGGTRPLGMI
jgi:hypothetical protein